METKDIILCMGSSCYTRGNSELTTIIQDFIIENALESTTCFRGELCSCNCKNGPNIRIGDKRYNNIDKTTAISILKDHFPA